MDTIQMNKVNYVLDVMQHAKVAMVLDLKCAILVAT